MRNVTDIIPGMALFLAGMAAGVLSSSPKPREAKGASAEDAAEPQAAEAGTADVSMSDAGDLASRMAAAEQRFSRIEARLDEYAAKLAEVPTTSQIVSVMEQLLSKTMTSLDERLTTQAHSIEVLKTTVSQTDSLLERVLESLDSLESYSDPAETGEDALFSSAV